MLRANELHVPTVLKAGSLKLMENSGPVLACNGIALHFTKYSMITLCHKVT